MADRKTLLSTSTGAPKVQYSNVSVPQGAFGDASGLISLGRGVSDLGQAGANTAINTAYRDRRNAQRLADELEARQNKDASLKLENTVRAIRTAMAREIETKEPTWSASEIVDRTNEIVADYRSKLDDELNTVREKDQAFSRIATGDQVDRYWSGFSDPIIERAYGNQAVKTQVTREQETVIAAQGRINDAGTNLEAVLNSAQASVHEVENVGKGQYSDQFRNSFRPGTVAPAVTSALQAAVVQSGGWTPQIKQAADIAHKNGWLTTENRERLMVKAAVAEKVTQEELNARLNANIASVSSGKLQLNESVLAGIVGASGRQPDSALSREVEDRVLLAGAEGTVAGRAANGQFIFPFSAKVSNGEATIFQAQDALKRGNIDELRGVITKLLPDIKDAQQRVANMKEADVRATADKLLVKINDQINLPKNQLAENDPSVMNVAVSNPGDVPSIINTYNAWYEANDIPQEQRILVHRPHISALKETFKQGDINKFKEQAKALAGAYGRIAPIHFGRALGSDPETVPFAAPLRIISSAQNSRNENVQFGAIQFGEAMIDAMNTDFSSFKDITPDTERDVERMLQRAYMVKNTNDSREELAASMSAPYFEASQDQSIHNIMTTLTEEGPAMTESMMNGLKKVVLKNAYASGGNSSRNIAKESVSVANSLSTAFMVVRTGGKFNNDSPGFILMTPDAKRRGAFEDAVLGPKGSQSTSVAEDAEYLAKTIDAVMMGGLEDAKYGGLGILGKIDDKLGQSILGSFGYRVNGFENRDQDFWNPYATTSKIKLPDSLKIDWANLVTSDNRPVAANRLFANETASLTAKRVWDQEVKTSKGFDAATQNRQVASKHGFFKQLPSGNLQLFIRPNNPQIENVPGGVEGAAVPAYTKGPDGKLTPVILPMDELLAFRDRNLNHRLDPATSSFR